MIKKWEGGRGVNYWLPHAQPLCGLSLSLPVSITVCVSLPLTPLTQPHRPSTQGHTRTHIYTPHTYTYIHIPGGMIKIIYGFKGVSPGRGGHCGECGRYLTTLPPLWHPWGYPLGTGKFKPAFLRPTCLWAISKGLTIRCMSPGQGGEAEALLLLLSFCCDSRDGGEGTWFFCSSGDNRLMLVGGRQRASVWLVWITTEGPASWA